MKTWLAGFCRVGLQSSAPTMLTASSPMPRSALSSVITPVPMRGVLALSPDSPYCLTKRTACLPSHEPRAPRARVFVALGEMGGDVGRVGGTQELLDVFPPAALEHTLDPADLLVSEGVVHGDGGHSPVLEGLGRVVTQG